MNPCPECGDPFIGRRHGLGIHVSSLWAGLWGGLATAAVYVIASLVHHA